MHICVICTAADASTCSLDLRSHSAPLVTPQISPMKPNTYIQRRSISGAAAKHTQLVFPFSFSPVFSAFLTLGFSHFSHELIARASELVAALQHAMQVLLSD